MEPESWIQAHRGEFEEISQRHGAEERVAVGLTAMSCTATRMRRSSGISVGESWCGMGSEARWPTSKVCLSTCDALSSGPDHR